MTRRKVVAVAGSGAASEEMMAAARAVGACIVDCGARVLTGGRTGVMQAASEGAHQSAAYREGDVLALLPGVDVSVANPWVDVALPTGLGHARNAVISQSADVLVLVGGSAGALSEVALACKMGKPVFVAAWSSGVASDLRDAPSLLPQARRLHSLEQLRAALTEALSGGSPATPGGEG